MLKVYNQNKEFQRYISDYSDLCIESTLSTGDKVLTFTYNVRKSDDIQNEYYIETKDDRYVVKAIDVSSGKFPEYTCELDLEDLEAEMFETFSAIDVTAEAAAKLALAGTGWTVDSDIEKLRSVATLKATPLTILGKIRDAFMCEIKYDTINKVVYFREEFGEDKGVYFVKDLNLKKVTLTNDSYDYYTRIIPIGEDDLRITDVNDGVEYVENYQYSDKIRTLIWEDTSYTDAEALLEDATAKLEDLSKPAKSYSADVVDLAKQSTKYSIMEFNLGDTILLLDEQTGIKDKQRIVKLKEYPQTPEKNSCELSNTVLTFEEMQDKLQAAADAFEEITNSDGTVNGYYVYGVTSDGVVVIEVSTDSDGNTTTTSTTLSSYLNTVTTNITAVTAIIGDLEANSLTAEEADLKYATIENLSAATTDIESLTAKYADIESLIVDELAAEIANINLLLAGNVGAGTVQTIHLTSENSVIDEAVITNALINNAIMSTLLAGTIYTDYVTIMSESGNLYITDNTIQITDESGTVRVQIGEDASGDYNLYLWDSGGTLIWNAYGLTEEGLTGNGAIIKDAAVADDAAISGYKLDIDSVISCIEDNGSLTVDYAQVVIDNTTLSAWYATVNSAVSDLESSTSTLQTQLSVVQGDIEAKVWQTDIDTAISSVDTQITTLSDQYAEITTNLSGITAEVSTLTTTVSEQADSIGELIKEHEIYYAVSDTEDYYASSESDGTLAFLGTALLGQMILDYYGEWSTEKPDIAEGEYLWQRERILYANGTEEWTDPVLVTDLTVRESISSLTQKTAELELTDESISGSVSLLKTELYENYSTTIEMETAIKQTSSSIMATIAGAQTTWDTSDLGYTIDHTSYGAPDDNEMEASDYTGTYYLDQNTGCVYYSDGSEWILIESLETTIKTAVQASLVLEIKEDSSGNLYGALSANADRVEFCAGEFVINSDNGGQFTFDADGNATFSGELKAASGSFSGDVYATSFSLNGATLTMESRGIEGTTIDTDGSVTGWSTTCNSLVVSTDNALVIDGYSGFYGGVYMDEVWIEHASVLNMCTYYTYANIMYIRGSGGLYFYDEAIHLSPSNSGTTLYCSGCFATADALYVGNTKYTYNSESCMLNVNGNSYLNGVVYCSKYIATGGCLLIGNTYYGSSIGTYMLNVNGDSYLNGGLTVTGSLCGNAGIELYHSTPYIDFHYGSSTADYTSRIIEQASGVLTVTGGLTVSSALKVSGATTLSSTLAVTSAVTFSSYLNASGYVKGSYLQGQYIELSGSTPFIDFHYGSSTADYTSRIIESASGTLTVTGSLTVNSALTASGTITFPGVLNTSASSTNANLRMNPNTGQILLISSSSERYKNITREMTEADILPLFNIPTYWYQYNDGYLDCSDERYEEDIPGFIAERWNEVLPIAVDHNSDGTAEVWNSNIVVPLTFEMVKYNHSEIEELKAQIAELQAQLAVLQATA